MQIRDYTAADRNACIEIFDTNTPFFFDPAERQYLQNWLTARDENQLAHQSNMAEHFYVLEQNKSVVACGGFYIPAAEKRVNIVWGMVLNSQHKKGLGSELLRYRIKLIKQLYPGFVISMDTTQHSSGFFTRLGFSLEKISDNYYGPGLHGYFMHLK